MGTNGTKSVCVMDESLRGRTLSRTNITFFFDSNKFTATSMGALNKESITASEGVEYLHQAAETKTKMTTTASPETSFVLSTSSCFDSSPSSSWKSPPRLRRSTLDLSQIRSSGNFQRYQANTQESLQDDNGDGLPSPAGIQDEVSTGLANSRESDPPSILESISLLETGFKLLLGEAQQHVGNVITFLLNSIFATNSSELEGTMDPSVHYPNATIHQQQKYEEPPPDPLLSPARLTKLHSNTRDEWGHFADFAEEVGDHNTFIPNFLSKRISLETLEEDESHDDDDDTFSF